MILILAILCNVYLDKAWATSTIHMGGAMVLIIIVEFTGRYLGKEWYLNEKTSKSLRDRFSSTFHMPIELP